MTKMDVFTENLWIKCKWIWWLGEGNAKPNTSNSFVQIWSSPHIKHDWFKEINNPTFSK